MYCGLHLRSNPGICEVNEMFEVLLSKIIDRLEQEDLSVCCMDNEEERERVAIALLSSLGGEILDDGQGQIVIYTGVYHEE